MEDTTGGPGVALLGAGIFSRNQYLPVLRGMQDVMTLKAIWSRSEAAARDALSLAQGFAATVEAKWGDEGLGQILADPTVHAVLVVLPPQVQLEVVVRALEAGKHVLQEKPVGSTVADVLHALSKYKSLAAQGAQAPIWAVAENYRFEPALLEGARLVQTLGDLMAVEVIVELPMQPSNPYYSSAWRRDPAFEGALIKDGGVHFIAGLRLITGCEVVSVSAITRHVDTGLPPPDNVSALIQLDNGCAGVLVMSWSSTSRKVSWRVVGSKGTVEVERVTQGGQAGYVASLYPRAGELTSYFEKFCGVQEELKAFVGDVANAVFSGGDEGTADERSSVLQGLRDLAVIEAMLVSGAHGGSKASAVVICAGT